MKAPAIVLLVSDGETALRLAGVEVPRNALDNVFDAWVAENTAELPVALNQILNDGSAQHNYQSVAALGFAANAGSADSASMALLKSRLAWLSGREPQIDGVPAPFCNDPVALLGISLGAVALNDASLLTNVREWFSRFSRSTYEHERTDDWQRCLMSVVQRLLDSSPVLPLPAGAAIADVRLFLNARALLPAMATTEQEEAEADVISLVKECRAVGLSSAQVSVRLAALTWVRRSVPAIVPGRATVEQVVQLLRRVPAGFRRWTRETKPRTKGATPRTWHIDNEYHVQNLLYFLLAPIFPDLTDEPYLEQVGQKNPRADLFIPCLKVIIEVKFQRAADAPQKVIDEIAADASLYLVKGSPYTGIISFIWDDAARVSQHDYLVRGLQKLKGIIDAVVMPRPGDFSSEA